MYDHPHHPRSEPRNGIAQAGRLRISRQDNAILMVLSESPTFLACNDIVAATGDYPLPYQLSLATARRRLPDLRRRRLVERVPRHGGFRITALDELAKHDI